MRIVMVWVVASTLMFMISIGWYVSLPIVVGIAQSVAGGTSGTALSILTAVQYVCYIWGPLFDIFLLLWALISSQQRDIESEMYG